MEPLTIVLIVLVVAAVWAVVELALTLRKTRQSVSELTESVNDTMGELRPVISKLDGAADELVPAARQLEPILEKASTTVDLVNVDLVRIEGILSDVNSVTDTGARVTGAVSGAADAVASGVAGMVGKIGGRPSKVARQAAKLEAAEQAAAASGEGGQGKTPAHHKPTPEVRRVAGDEGYFTYPSSSEAKTDAAAEADADRPEKNE